MIFDRFAPVLDADGFVALDRALDRLLEVPPERFATRDPALWRADVRTERRGEELVVEVLVRDAAGRPQRDASVNAVVFVDGFFELATARAASDEEGRARLRLTAPAGGGPHHLHVSAGLRWPLVEVVARV